MIYENQNSKAQQLFKLFHQVAPYKLNYNQFTPIVELKFTSNLSFQNLQKNLQKYIIQPKIQANIFCTDKGTQIHITQLTEKRMEKFLGQRMLQVSKVERIKREFFVLKWDNVGFSNPTDFVKDMLTFLICPKGWFDENAYADNSNFQNIPSQLAFDQSEFGLQFREFKYKFLHFLNLL